MEGCTRLRVFRLKFGISLSELAEAAGVSSQYMSRVELGQAAPTRTLERKGGEALEQIIAQRRMVALAMEYSLCVEKGGLLKETEEITHGL